VTTTPMTHRVFVYGSLKRGHWNNALLGNFHAVFKGETVTEQLYYMLSGSVQGSRAFPTILDDDPALTIRAVRGEIYHVSDECLAQLDRLERVPDSYERKIADVTEDGHPVKAHIYVGNPARWKRSGWPPWTGVNENGELVWTGT
jgi:gamma-glutamylaminecyclotransferase